MAQISRRGFIAGSAIAAGLMGLVACGNTGGAAAVDLPTADQYPIDPDPEGTEAKWTSETTRDGWTRVTAEGAPELGVQDPAKIIQVGGFAFKDLNGNGKLDLYEDWRQPHDVRAAALAETMSAEEAMLLMWHGGDQSQGGGPMGDIDAPEVKPHNLLFEGSRAGVSRLMSTINSYASDVAWINEVQAICEDSAYGIPYLNSTDQYPIFNIPDSVGLAAAMDKEVWRKAGMWYGRAYRATGVRCLLGPQVDVYSQPIGCRLSGSVCEDPAVNRDYAAAFSGGMQSTWGDDAATDDLGWGKDSVAAMLKHYVGEGSVEGGRNDHGSDGAFNVFPGDNFNAHLIPFLDGGLHLDSATGTMSAVMPCYGIAFSDDEKYGENVGSGYNKKTLGILRNAGWDGMLTTDWGILNGQTYGVTELSEPERYKKMVDATVDQYGGGFEPEVGKQTIELMKAEIGEEETTKRMQDSARRIAKVMMDVDLFENPYTDRAAAKEMLESTAGYAFGLEASEKSIVMLKNAGGIIKEGGFGEKVKAYIAQNFVQPSFMSSLDPYFKLAIDETLAGEAFDFVTDVIGEPTGVAQGMFGAAPDPDAGPVFQASDAAVPSADELKDVQVAIVRIGGPKDAHDGVAGGSGFGMAQGPSEYLPVSLQYRPYTADDARDPSIGGFIVDGAKENRTYKGKSTEASNEGDLDKVIAVREALPADAKLICIVECTRPMIFSELEPYCDVILQSYYSQGNPTDEAYANIITGKTEPSGLLPFQQPANMATVEAQLEDVPRDMDCYVDSEGNVYDFCFGLNWSGVIDDERTAAYKANPLTEPETEVVWG